MGIERLPAPRGHRVAGAPHLAFAAKPSRLYMQRIRPPSEPRQIMTFGDHQPSVREQQVHLRLLVPHPEARNASAGTTRAGRSLALLAYLYLGPPATTRDELCELLWDPEPGHDSQHRLRELLSSTRKFLPDGVLITEGRSVSVDRAAIACDVTLFRDAAVSGRPSEAAGLYEADFFAGGIPSGASLFSDWADGIGRGLREELAAVLRLAIEVQEASGNLRAAAVSAERLWRLEQDSEEAASLYITFWREAGDGPAALGAAAEIEAHWAELGIDMPEKVAAAVVRARALQPPTVSDSPGVQLQRATDDAGSMGEEFHRTEPLVAFQGADRRQQSATRRPLRLFTLALIALVGIGLTSFLARGSSLDPAVLLVPAHGSPEVSTTPTLVWNSVSGANRYWLLIATTAEALPSDRTANSCSGCVVSGSTSATSHSLPDPFPLTPGGGKHPALNAGTTYFWKVLAWNTAGPHPSGQYSDTWVFRTAEAP